MFGAFYFVLLFLTSYFINELLYKMGYNYNNDFFADLRCKQMDWID
jgi:hypothetical protein